MNLLIFEVKLNLKRAARIRVKSKITGEVYGSFLADDTSTFDGWDKMSNEEIIELKHYMDNLNAVSDHLGKEETSRLSDYRLRLPISFSHAIDDISEICYKNSIKLNIYEGIIASIIQNLKIATTHLKGEEKKTALTALDRIGLGEYKKLDHEQQIKAIFSEVLSIHNKSEKLHEKSKLLFNKDKSFSPKSIENMAKGEMAPSKWLVASAIALLLEERETIVRMTLPDKDIFLLLAKPLLDNKQKTLLKKLVAQYDLGFLTKEIEAYS